MDCKNVLFSLEKRAPADFSEMLAKAKKYARAKEAYKAHDPSSSLVIMEQPLAQESQPTKGLREGEVEKSLSVTSKISPADPMLPKSPRPRHHTAKNVLSIHSLECSLNLSSDAGHKATT